MPFALADAMRERGAVQAAIAGKAVPGQVSALYAPLRPAVERAGSDLVAATQANARIQADLLVTASPVLSSADLAGASEGRGSGLC
jgi:hypothetical protein